MVFTNSQNLPARCVINAISILTYFLSCPSIELSNKLYTTSMYISKAICKSVTGKCVIDPHVVDIASNLSSSLLRYNYLFLKLKMCCVNYGDITIIEIMPRIPKYFYRYSIHII